MKRKLLSLALSAALVLTMIPATAATAFGVSGVKIDETHFPDQGFRQEVEEWDFDADGYLSEMEIDSVELLVFSEGDQISNLIGIEYFTSLESLHIFDDIGLSGALDLSTLHNLNSLTIRNNQVSSVKLSPKADYYDIDLTGNKMESTSAVTGQTIKWDGDFIYDYDFNDVKKKAVKATIGKKIMVAKDDSWVAAYKFTAKKTGTYLIRFTNFEGSVDVYDKEGYEVANNIISPTLTEVSDVLVKAKKNQIFYMQCQLFDAPKNNESFKITCPGSIVVKENNVEYRANIDDWTLDVKPIQKKATVTAKTPAKMNDGVYTQAFRKLNLHEGITAIGKEAYKYYDYVTEVQLPETLKTIGAGAFIDCFDLNQIVIPASVKKIGKCAFGYETSLNSEGKAYFDTVVEKKKNFKIYGKAGTAAQTYAKNNKITFVKVLNSPVAKVKKNASGKVQISWNKVKNAGTYEVWAKTGKNGTYKKLATTKKTSYVNTSAKKGKTYFYKVKAVHTKDKYQNSFFSAEKKIVYK